MQVSSTLLFESVTAFVYDDNVDAAVIPSDAGVDARGSVDAGISMADSGTSDARVDAAMSVDVGVADASDAATATD